MDTNSISRLMDRMDIQDRIYLYCELVDNRRFDEIPALFTEDAEIDFSTCGSVKGSPKELAAALKKSFRYFSDCMHLVTNLVIRVSEDGRTATSKYYLYNPMSWKDRKGVQTTFQFGSHYDGEWIKTEDGWKLTKFIQLKHYRLPPVQNDEG